MRGLEAYRKALIRTVVLISIMLPPVGAPIQERPAISRNMRPKLQSALIFIGKGIAPSVAGHAELAPLNSRMLSTRVLLNRGTTAAV